MTGLETSLERARDLDPAALAESIQAIGFECTRCGRCCSGTSEDPHTATIFPGEVRSIASATGEDWDAIARPIPFGLQDGEGETFEWALQTDSCGDCRFLVSEGAGEGERNDSREGNKQGNGTACSIYGERPLICRTYPFSVSLAAGDDSAQPVAHEEAVVASEGDVRAHECPGLGRDIDRERALELARTLTERTIRELEEAIAVREQYDPAVGQGEPVVVHDSEGAKRPDGSEIGASGE